MRSFRLLGLLERLLVVVVLFMSGLYMLVYLYRWEWNRALLSGVFFVAAELALATSVVLRRVAGLARDGDDRARSSLVLSRLHEANAGRPDPFLWLRSRDRVAVFVPVLLGAGVLLSAIAYVVEHVAEATANRTVDRGLARRLGELTPSGPLVWDPPVAPAGPERHVVLRSVVAGAGVAIVALLALDWTMDLTQSRPASDVTPVRTAIELSVAQRGQETPARDTAEALWVACRPILAKAGPRHVSIVPVEGQRVRMEFVPGIGELTTRRLTGCLSDVRIPLIQARVLAVHHSA